MVLSIAIPVQLILSHYVLALLKLVGCVLWHINTSRSLKYQYSFMICKQIVCRYYLPTPPLGQDMTQGQFLSGV